MPGPAVIFRDVHRHLRHVHDLQEQLNRIPVQRKAQQTKLARHEGALHEAQEAVKKHKVTAHKKEGELKDKHAQIGRFERQLNEITSKKEYDALQQEIAHARADCGRLEDEILTALTDADERSARLPELEKAAAQAKEELARFEADAATRKASLSAQLAEAQGKLAAAEALIPEDLRIQYRRLVGARGADALAAVRNRTCAACYTEITVQHHTDLQQEKFLACKSCGRFLYLPEQPAAGADEDE
jgi:predicted  nucleic acid-binding Zn-ribbon protein